MGLHRFNPRAREGRDLHAVADALERFEVSIHAPARGATAGRRDTARNGQVSIHAPARGATTLPVDPQLAEQVSIHAPARGAT